MQATSPKWPTSSKKYLPKKVSSKGIRDCRLHLVYEMVKFKKVNKSKKKKPWRIGFHFFRPSLPVILKLLTFFALRLDCETQKITPVLQAVMLCRYHLWLRCLSVQGCWKGNSVDLQESHRHWNVCSHACDILTAAWAGERFDVSKQ